MKTMDEGPQRTDIVVQGKRRVMRRRLSVFAERAHRAAKLRGTVSILLAGSQEIRALNLRYRRKNKATDVLSFPSPEELRAHSAGDLAISVDIAAQNARELRHSLTEELAILILHGMLHLAGHDHETDAGEMAALEARLRRRLRLPDSLTERAKEPA